MLPRRTRAIAPANSGRAGLKAGEAQILDSANGVSVTPWRRVVLDIVGGFPSARPAVSCDHEQCTDDRQILQRMDQVVLGVGAGLIPEVMK